MVDFTSHIQLMEETLKELESKHKNMETVLAVKREGHQNVLSRKKAEYEAAVCLLNEEFRKSVEDIMKKDEAVLEEIKAIKKAITALGGETKTENKAVVSTEKKVENVPAETIYDAVVEMLSRKTFGMTMAEIGNSLVEKKLLDGNKKVTSVMSGFIGTMRRQGLIDQLNGRYVLSDKAEAARRLALRQGIFRFLQKDNPHQPVSIKDVVTEMKRVGLIDGDDLHRRIRGVLMGMSQGQYVERLIINNTEHYLCVAA